MLEMCDHIVPGDNHIRKNDQNTYLFYMLYYTIYNYHPTSS